MKSYNPRFELVLAGLCLAGACVQPFDWMSLVLAGLFLLNLIPAWKELE